MHITVDTRPEDLVSAANFQTASLSNLTRTLNTLRAFQAFLGGYPMQVDPRLTSKSGLSVLFKIPEFDSNLEIIKRLEYSFLLYETLTEEGEYVKLTLAPEGIEPTKAPYVEPN